MPSYATIDDFLNYVDNKFNLSILKKEILHALFYPAHIETNEQLTFKDVKNVIISIYNGTFDKDNNPIRTKKTNEVLKETINLFQNRILYLGDYEPPVDDTILNLTQLYRAVLSGKTK